MAQHGGPEGLPRGHRPRAPVMSAPAPLTAPLAPLRPVAAATATSNNNPLTAPVTLVTPRPENERSGNEYTEAPFRHAAPPPPPPRPHRLPAPLLPPPSVISGPLSNANHCTTAIVKQPLSFGKSSTTLNGPECNSRPSIMCPECGQCRCEQCQQPRPLPQKWACNGTCLMSADSLVDYASCLCCVKGMFYHCSDADGSERSCADDPCSCAPDRRAVRWSCLATLSCVLPCLWLYWPLRGAKRAVELCYARHSRQGCRCRPPAQQPLDKRLLDASAQDF